MYCRHRSHRLGLGRGSQSCTLFVCYRVGCRSQGDGGGRPRGLLQSRFPWNLMSNHLAPW